MLNKIPLRSAFCDHRVQVYKEKIGAYVSDSIIVKYRCAICDALGAQSWKIDDWKAYKEPHIKETLELIKKGLEAGLTVSELCIALDVDKKTIWREAKANGILPKP